MGGYWMIRTVRSGKVIEKSQYYVGQRRPRASRKKGASSAAKMDANMNQAVRQLARTMNCNWGHGDLLLTLKYDEEHLPEDFDAAERAGAKWWRRMHRELKELGIKSSGVWMTSETDPETGEVVRLHHHAVISVAGIEILRDGEGKLIGGTVGGRTLADVWGQGGVDIQLLRDQDDYTPIARYFASQARRAGDAKKWHVSRGLKQPVIESERVVANPRELHTPAGATVCEIGKYEEGSGTHYIRYIRKPRPKKVGGHKERENIGGPELLDEEAWGIG